MPSSFQHRFQIHSMVLFTMVNPFEHTIWKNEKKKNFINVPLFTSSSLSPSSSFTVSLVDPKPLSLNFSGSSWNHCEDHRMHCKPRSQHSWLWCLRQLGLWKDTCLFCQNVNFLLLPLIFIHSIYLFVYMSLAIWDKSNGGRIQLCSNVFRNLLEILKQYSKESITLVSLWIVVLHDLWSNCF